MLETLTQWSRHTATEAEVSDVYVRLGYEFNIACRAFTAIGVETADLGPVPDLLRSILEDTLSQEASPASLDKFLPRIRDIIINLLHGLKRKQQRLRSRQAKETGSGSGASFAARQGSLESNGSAETGLTQLLEDTPSHRQSGASTDHRRYGSGGSATVGADNGAVPRGSSMQNGVSTPTRQDSGGNRLPNDGRNVNRDAQRSIPTSNSGSSMSSNTMQNIPVLAPYPETDSTSSQRERPPPEAGVPLPPPSQPRQQDALAALQRGPDLERRASRRYSAYQISRHLGASPNGVPMLPPAQHSPVPNRGKDVRESLNAVRTRGSTLHSRQRSNNRLFDSSPTRNNDVSRRISEESSQSSEAPVLKPPPDPRSYDSPTTKTPEDKLRQPDVDFNGNDKPIVGATLSGPPINEVEGIYDTTKDEALRKPPSDESSSCLPGSEALTQVDQFAAPSDPQAPQFIPEQSPQPGKELTLFLQYKSKIKKFVLPDGSSDLSIARLQLAFIEKFAWNTHSNGNDLPEIYIQDPVSGVRHELEDLSDVKDRSVLVLNIEILDEVKKHIDEGLGGLRRMVEGVRAVVDGQQSAIKRVADKQQDTAKDMARLATHQLPPATRSVSAETPRASITRSSTSSVGKSQQLSEIRSLRRDLAVVRQTYSTFVSDINASMSEVRTIASSVKTVALDTVVPSLNNSTGRAYVNAGKKTLAEESEKIVNRVDDLQDLVEDLRKDVVSRGVRPLPRQLETVSKDISIATAELKKMQEYLKREKPVWTKIWEKELELVCTDRDLLTMQEELAADLEDDLEKATQTFALVEQATKQQNLGNSQSPAVQLRSTSRGMSSVGADHDVDPMKAKDGVLGEVRALQPNHETRLEAIERAEKLRQKELEERRDGEFKKELGSFVEEGKLKKSGGVEEAERLRKAKDEQNRRSAWETQQGRAAGKGKRVETSTAAEEGEETASPEERAATPEPEFAEAQEQPSDEREAETPNDSTTY